MNVLRKLGFSEHSLDSSNNWYSIIVNGVRHGFFNSFRGLKQDDPLSPALFVIRAEALLKALNQLNDRDDFKGFSMSMNGPQVNHLCYVDDIVLFSSINKTSIKLIMRELKKYQDSSG